MGDDFVSLSSSISCESEDESEEDFSETDTDSFPADENGCDEHHAHVSCYLKDDLTGKVFGVTNKHVALHASSGVYIKANERCKTLLGSPVSIQNEHSLDIALIEIHQEIRGNVCNQITDYRGRKRKLELFRGERNEIFGKKVFQCKSFSFLNDFNFDPKIIFGQVCSEGLNNCIFTGHTSQFCVEDIGGDQFSKPGDSGTAVALEMSEDSKTIYIIGMIVGGMQVGYTCCIYLPDAIRELNRDSTMNLQLKVREISDPNPNVTNTKQFELPCNKRIIEPCVMIFIHFKTPEQVSPYSFDLVQFVVGIAGYRYEEFSANENKDLLEHEKQLKVLLNLRKDIPCDESFNSDRPEFIAMEQGLKAVEYLHSGQFDDVELKLKIAMNCVPKCQRIGLRLFPANFTYVIWYFILQQNKESRIIVENLIEEGLEFCNENHSCDGFPKETAGFLYYELSRCHIQKYDEIRKSEDRNKQKEINLRLMSIQYATTAVRIMEETHLVDNTPESLVRRSYIQCELAFAILGCGNNFDVANETFEVSSEDITEAGDLLEMVKTAVVDTGLLMKHAMKHNLYLISVCDLYFRQGNYLDSLKTAYQCLKAAERKEDAWAIKRAQKRFDFLSKFIL